MKKISTVAILTGSVNISVLFTIYYNYATFPPLAYLILSFCLLLLIFLAEYEYRRFKLLESESAVETTKIFDKYLYLYAVGVVLVSIKLTMHLNPPHLPLNYEKFVFVDCFDPENNLYFNILYYLSNYLLGKYYIHLFKRLHNKFLNKDLEFTETSFATRDTRCTVCLDDISAGNRTALTKCGHYFHQKCLRRWLEVKNTCPICKQSVVQEVSIEDGV